MRRRKNLLFLFVVAVGIAAVIAVPPQYRVAALGAALLVAGVAFLIWSWIYQKPIDVKDVAAGHGQHGKSRWMNDTEKNSIFLSVPSGRETEPGFVIDFSAGHWRVDTSEHNVMLVAPPGSGKTTRIIIPTVRYNLAVNKNTGGHGASMVILDCKGELYRRNAAQLQAAGYRTPALDLRNISKSSRYNFIANVNAAIDEYRAATDKLSKARAYGRAERYAKVAASLLIDSDSAEVKSESSDYFNETARGLITGVILLVSEYAPAPQRHIISVFNLILEMNGQIQGSGGFGQPQKTKMEALLEKINDPRIRYYTGPATSADMRTSMNVFSSALGKLVKFIDAELEQVLIAHDSDFDAKTFISQPSALFLISPDENTTRHFISSLIVRNLMNDLIEIAETEYGGVLPRKVLLLLDEFGQQPPIPDYDALSAAMRSRGGRLMIALQDFGQLQKHYSKTKSEIIRGTNQTIITSFVAPAALSTAETISKILGNETILTGSSSIQQGKTSSTKSLVGRPLMSPSDLIAMPVGEFIVIRGTAHPLKVTPPGYWTYLGDAPEPQRPDLEYREVQVADADLLSARAGVLSYDLTPGMFDIEENEDPLPA